ncbi:MAG: HAD family hydrolase [Erysipelotrichaceae bacterium]|nr:HAD family hydrolase [Erysipelotrichaceae bacterium]
MSDYQNYIFDLYGTLIDIHTDERRKSFWSSFADSLKALGLHYRPGELQKLYLRLCTRETERMRKETGRDMVEIDLAPVFTALCRNQGVEPSEADIVSIARSFRGLSTYHLRLFAGVTEVLQTLRDQGKGIYLLSNAQKLFSDWEMGLLGLTPFFDGIFYSSDQGCRKPDLRFFERLLKQYGLKKSESVMIGNDYYDDIAPALACGISGIYIPSPQTRRYDGPLPQRCLKLNAISEILKLQQEVPTADRD